MPAPPHQPESAKALTPKPHQPQQQSATGLGGKIATARDTPPKTTEATLIEKITRIIGLVAGLAAFVYIAGAAVLAVRLEKAGLPASEVVTSLPRELLIGVGLQYVVAPALALAMVAGLEILILIKWKRGVWVALLAGLFLTAVLVALLLVVRTGDEHEFRDEGAVGWWIAFLAAYVATLVIYVAAKGKLETLYLVALVALGVGLIAAVARVAYERKSTRLQEATVCVNDGGPNYEGFLVGETSDAVYLGRLDDRAEPDDGEKSGTRPPPKTAEQVKVVKVVLAIRKDRVGELRIGDRSSWNCSVPRPTQDRRARP